ncbi:toprim domain-containing protein [Ferrimonas marina]|uniref:Toprim domain-containing protein n=1 Tax=Ferrimonas marina TaxID=299255 RepID=A0A1M5T7U3_9GAMM|nr:hypothetical protein [Ferrimonas marina]SHH46433.1 hypothetical protein SAMN02745129_2023 [Ferrimonas marina]
MSLRFTLRENSSGKMARLESPDQDGWEILRNHLTGAEPSEKLANATGFRIGQYAKGGKGQIHAVGMVTLVVKSINDRAAAKLANTDYIFWKIPNTSLTQILLPLSRDVPGEALDGFMKNLCGALNYQFTEKRVKQFSRDISFATENEAFQHHVGNPLDPTKVLPGVARVSYKKLAKHLSKGQARTEILKLMVERGVIQVMDDLGADPQLIESMRNENQHVVPPNNYGKLDFNPGGQLAAKKCFRFFTRQKASPLDVAIALRDDKGFLSNSPMFMCNQGGQKSWGLAQVIIELIRDDPKSKLIRMIGEDACIEEQPTDQSNFRHDKEREEQRKAQQQRAREHAQARNKARQEAEDYFKPCERDHQMVLNYLSSRWGFNPGRLPPTLLWHPGKEYYHDGQVLGSYPAMSAWMVRYDSTKDQFYPVGGHRTFLNPNGTKATYTFQGIERKLPVGKKQITSFEESDGAFTPLSSLGAIKAAGVLAVAEGIESVGPALYMLKIPSISMVNAGRLQDLEPRHLPPEVQHIHVFADLDASGTGLRAAMTLQHRMQNAGIQCDIHLPQYKQFPLIFLPDESKPGITFDDCHRVAEKYAEQGWKCFFIPPQGHKPQESERERLWRVICDGMFALQGSEERVGEFIPAGDIHRLEEGLLFGTDKVGQDRLTLAWSEEVDARMKEAFSEEILDAIKLPETNTPWTDPKKIHELKKARDANERWVDLVVAMSDAFSKLESMGPRSPASEGPLLEEWHQMDNLILRPKRDPKLPKEQVPYSDPRLGFGELDDEGYPFNMGHDFCDAVKERGPAGLPDIKIRRLEQPAPPLDRSA